MTSFPRHASDQRAAIAPAQCRSVLREYLAIIGRPISLLLLQCEADQITPGSDWHEVVLPALETAAREVMISVTRVTCEGDFDAQMSALLIAATSS